MDLSKQQVLDLIERSKNDREIIVGSEVRELGSLALEALAAREQLQMGTGAHDFAQAVRWLKMGRCVARKSWGGIAYIAVQIPDKNSKMTDPYIYMCTGSDFNIKCPYQPNQTDILASEWVLI